MNIHTDSVARHFQYIVSPFSHPGGNVEWRMKKVSSSWKNVHFPFLISFVISPPSLPPPLVYQKFILFLSVSKLVTQICTSFDIMFINDGIEAAKKSHLVNIVLVDNMLSKNLYSEDNSSKQETQKDEDKWTLHVNNS